jgi:hypothetical protein
MIQLENVARSDSPEILVRRTGVHEEKEQAYS